MKTLIDTVIEAKPKRQNKEQKTILFSLILHNDSENTFDHVMSCLSEYCEHTDIQAEQCALTAHLAGKCIIKIGPLEKLKEIREALVENNLTVEIL